MPPRGHRSRRTHCPRGHLFDRANTYVRPDNGRQQCRTCARERQKAHRASLRCRLCLGTSKVLVRDAAGRFERSLAPCPLCGDSK